MTAKNGGKIRPRTFLSSKCIIPGRGGAMVEGVKAGEMGRGERTDEFI